VKTIIRASARPPVFKIEEEKPKFTASQVRIAAEWARDRMPSDRLIADIYPSPSPIEVEPATVTLTLDVHTAALLAGLGGSCSIFGGSPFLVSIGGALDDALAVAGFDRRLHIFSSWVLPEQRKVGDIVTKTR
jgi:hypothetical protein